MRLPGSQIVRRYWLQAGGKKPSGGIALASQAYSFVIKEDEPLEKEFKRRRYYEKPYAKRNRKIGESLIRAQNRKIGSMLDFIVKRKGQGF